MSGGDACTPNTTEMPVVGSMKYSVPAQPAPRRRIISFHNYLFKAIEGLHLHQAEPFRRRPIKSVVSTARAVLQEVPTLITVSESDLIPFADNNGTKISCTISAFKIALGRCRPAVR
jgi:hypothetical protein